MPRAVTNDLVSKLHERNAILMVFFVKIHNIPLPGVLRWGCYMLRDSLDLTVDLLQKL
jgi:hypothetical protein